MKRYLIAGLAFAAAFWPSLALWPNAAWANWQYTKWGMTPEQVQSAAKGKLSPVATPNGCAACTAIPLLAGDYEVAGQLFRVRFEFAVGNSLATVVLSMPARRQTWGCNDLFDSLSLKYGVPAWQAPLTGDGSLPNARWLDSREHNTVFFNDISAQTGQCEVQYSPLGGGKGL
ncbi:MAG TPA: hypothetical protein VH189_08885 [Rhizomicrobium sp.]|nr:hypothetical protein [Rhizomicrobium sp.]